MDNVSLEKFIYAFTGMSKDEYLEKIIQDWNEYLAAGGDPEKYIGKEKTA